MEIFKSPFLKTSTTSQSKRSDSKRPSSGAKLRLVEHSTADPAPARDKQSSHNAYLAVRFNRNLHAVKDSATEQQIQPMMARSFLNTATQLMVEQPEQAIPAQANSTADVVSALLA